MNSRPLRVLLADITRSHDGERISLSQRQCGAQPGDYPYYGPEGIIARIGAYAYEGEYILTAAFSRGGPWAVLVNGRFSAGTRVHVLSCGPGVEPGFLCELLNAMPAPHSPRSFRSIELKKLEALEFSLPAPEVQRRIIGALSSIEAKTVLLRDQNRVLHGMIQSLFDRVFIFSSGNPRPLGDFAAFRPAGSPSAVPGENPRGAAFYNLFLYPREDMHPFFIAALIKNPEFLSYAEGCVEGRIGKRRLDGERLMAFELSGPAESRRKAAGTYRDFNSLAEMAEKKLAGNSAELRVLQKLRRTLIPSPYNSLPFFPQKVAEVPAPNDNWPDIYCHNHGNDVF
jgi:hypothetical protein